LGVKRTEKSPLRDILARNMRLMRAERGWSQEFLAAEAGLNRTYVSAVERSEQNISLDNIWKIAGALGVPAARLIEQG
jgi:transcriptional regulator with XRE-family HTH domain